MKKRLPSPSVLTTTPLDFGVAVAGDLSPAAA